MEEHIELCT